MATKTHCKIVFLLPRRRKIEQTFMFDFYSKGISDIECEMLNGEIHFSSISDAKAYMKEMWRWLKAIVYYKGDCITSDGKFIRHCVNYCAEIVKGY